MLSTPLPRRRFLLHAGWLGLAAGVRPGALAAHPSGPAPSSSPRAPAALDYPRNALEGVRTVVGASHNDLEVVWELVTEQPAPTAPAPPSSPPP